MHISHLNTYLDTLGGAFNEDGVICVDCAFTTATGPGQLIPYYAGGVNVSLGTWASWYGFGLDCRNANDNLQGFFGNSAATSTAIYFNGCEMSRLDFNFFDVNGPLFYVRGGTQLNTLVVNGEANLFGTPGVVGSTTLFDPRGLQGFPLNNCVSVNIGGPLGALALKYSIPCVGSAMQIDNANQYLGVNVAPLYPLDVQPLQPSAWTVSFSPTGTNPYLTGTGYVHSVTVGPSVYSYTQIAGDTAAVIAAAVAGAVNSAPDPNVTAAADGGNVTLTVKLNTGALVVVSASDYNGSTTLSENFSLAHNTARFLNAAQNTQLLIGQQTITNPTNLLTSMQAAGAGNADLWISGQSTTAIPNLLTWAQNYQVYNQDATGFMSFTLNGGLAQGLNPFLTVKNRAGVNQFQVGSAGQLCAFGGSCITAWPNTFAALSGLLADAQLPADAVTTGLLGGSTLTAALANLSTTGDILAGGNLMATANIYANAGASTPGCLHLADTNAAHDSGFCAPASSTAGVLWTLPVADGTLGQVLQTSGTGALSWLSLPASPVPSVFGRTGAVVGAAGDYTAAQVTGALSTAPSALQTIFNSGAGYTQLALQESATQNANSKDALEFLNTAGTKCMMLGATVGIAEGDCTNYKFLFSSSTQALSSDALLAWKSANSVYAGSYDVGLARVATGGILRVSNGSSGWGALAAAQVIGGGTAPTVVCGTGAGATPPTGAACAVTGSDLVGTFVVTPTASPVASGVLATFTFGQAKATYPVNCDVTWIGTPQGLGLWPFVGPTNEPSQLADGAWVLTAGATALTAASTYRFGYKCF